ncbi:putative transcription factor GRAS family [Helianthus annuus]|uniref:Putative transcription factor GRAS n=1 Tax=Helianthus annuus TaxID=4232 RepID=A0A251RVK1_HELAN|nr:GRAS family protein RAD1 [Helianthus annuus]KAF5757881.1 putative transcription factor GRAS family [Helianthus annuus]KAJ0440450.1 putative transcription factor GRAS family [Helianthus annuus]KAJ0639140.1 putative transcription factor GRAS family [Helianthus annuus]KAJ0643108.1 putative transcription factor GRAS family [Helianthus annuus]KAJ0819206.1 putative transcription factor GRAS family [Helianthus annuus]
MTSRFFTRPLYSGQRLNHLKAGVHGVDSRIKLCGTKRKTDEASHMDTPNFLGNPMYEQDDVQAHTNTKDTTVCQDHSISPFSTQCYLSVIDNPSSPWNLFSLSSCGPKRMKRTVSMPQTTVDTSSLLDGVNVNIRRTSSTNSLPKLRFRDHVMTYTQRYLAAEAIEDAILENRPTKNEGNVDGMHLVQLLISCAEAVACRDKAHATNLLAELRANALVFGSSFQRVASCFMQGLTDRLALVQPLGALGLVAPTTNLSSIGSEKKEEALRLVYEVCPHIQFGHFVANLTILEAFEGESFVHVVDLGMTLGLPHGQQWRGLLDSLANHHGQSLRRLRITAVGTCVNRFHVIGDELEVYAQKLGINMEFSYVESSLEKLKPEDIKTYENEVLVVNSILQLHCVVKESRGALNSVLKIIHELSPKVLVLVEQDSSHNGPFFLGRFMEALYYYSAIFDALDAMLPKYDTRRAKIEQFYFAEEIKNIVSCEGPNRVERHERVDQWRRRMSRAGFQAAPVKLVAQAKQWLAKLEICEGYTIVEEKGSLVLGWKSKPIVAASCWKC